MFKSQVQKLTNVFIFNTRLHYVKFVPIMHSEQQRFKNKKERKQNSDWIKILVYNFNCHFIKTIWKFIQLY